MNRSTLMKIFVHINFVTYSTFSSLEKIQTTPNNELNPKTEHHLPYQALSVLDALLASRKLSVQQPAAGAYKTRANSVYWKLAGGLVIYLAQLLPGALSAPRGSSLVCSRTSPGAYLVRRAARGARSRCCACACARAQYLILLSSALKIVASAVKRFLGLCSALFLSLSLSLS